MRTPNLSALIAVADHGSVARAAHAEGTTRATLTRRIEALEALVGRPLLRPSRPGSAVTPTGMRLVGAGRVLRRDADRLLADLRSGRDLRSHRRIAVTSGLPAPFARRIAQTLHDDASMGELRLVVHDDPLRELDIGADMALMLGPASVRVGLRTLTLVDMGTRLMASPAYLRANRAPRSLGDLAGHPLLHWVRPGRETDRLPLLSGGSAPVSPWLTSSDSEWVRSAAEAGAGVGLLPWSPQFERRNDSRLVHVLPGLVGDACSLQLVASEDAEATHFGRLAARLRRALAG